MALDQESSDEEEMNHLPSPSHGKLLEPTSHALNLETSLPLDSSDWTTSSMEDQESSGELIPKQSPQSETPLPRKRLELASISTT